MALAFAAAADDAVLEDWVPVPPSPPWRAFAAFQRGDDDDAIDLIVPMLPDRERMDGSRAQVDLVEGTLLRAFLDAGRVAEARRLLAHRRPGPATLPVAGLEQGVPIRN